MRNVITILISVVIGYIILGYYNSYIGYYGYNKDKIRRFSSTIEESKKRDVFVKELHFKIDSVEIKNVFIEKGFKWGSSDKETKMLTLKDTYKKNKPDYPYQLIISYSDKQYFKMYIPKNDSILKFNHIKDTVLTNVYIRDSIADKLICIRKLKIW